MADHLSTCDNAGGPEDGGWVDDVLLHGPGAQPCLDLGEPVDRGTLRRLVASRQAELTAAGLRPGGTIALRLPPSMAYVVTLLAAWRAGAQVALLDHRLTEHEVGTALPHLAPQFVVEPSAAVSGPPRAVFAVSGVVRPYEGRPAMTPHVLIQLSSGSTGASKMIGRTARSLRAEIARYAQIEGLPQRGERVVALASMVHVLGLVGGLLYGLHAGAQVVAPQRLTVDAIVGALCGGDSPAVLLGVPSDAESLAAVETPPALPQFARMVTGGEPVPTQLWERFTSRYSTTLGNMYGMTEVGVVATDVFGEHRPSLAPAPGLRVREENGELLVATEDSPYVRLADPARWVDGWLYTRDAGTISTMTGRLMVHGRLDSQVSVGGLLVDLTEVEQTIAAVPGVTRVVVLHDGGIRAYVSAAPGTGREEIEQALSDQLAAYKRPQTLHLLSTLPLTSTGKPVRHAPTLRAAAEQAALPV